MRRLALGVASAAMLLALDARSAGAHAALRSTDPSADAALPAAPTAVRLSFSEAPEPSLSSIRVVDATGTAFEVGAPHLAPDGDNALVVALRPLEQRVYTVSWRTVSRVDGHVSAGAFAFGVGVAPSPDDRAAADRTRAPTLSVAEVAARATLLAGLLLLLGAARARAAAPALAACLAALLGLGLLAAVQRQGSWAQLASSPVGRLLGGRGALLVLAGAVLVAAWRRRRPAPLVAVVVSSVVVALHVSAGHAAAPHAMRWAVVAAQWAHVVAAAVWAGGLVALLAVVVRTTGEERAAVVRRFSPTAVAMVGIVGVTGVLRAVDEVGSLPRLWDTSYGTGVVVKAACFIGIVVLGARNRGLRHLLHVDLGGLRARGSAELALAVVAVVAAASLAALPPPASQAAAAVPGLVAEGTDFARALDVRLTTQSSHPGPNRFVVRVRDAESRRVERVTLRFEPLDDPGVAPTELALEPGAPGEYHGAGANLSLDGSWRVDVVVQHGAGSATVPLELAVRGPSQFASVERVPGRPVRHLVELAAGGTVRLWADDAADLVHAVFYDDFDAERPVARAVFTVTTNGVTKQLPARRLGPGRFATDAPAGIGELAVVGRTPDGTRLRAVVDYDGA